MNGIARWLPALLCLLVVGCGPTESKLGSATGPLFVVGISPFLENGDKDEVYRRVTQLLLEELPLDSSLRVFDAYHIRSVTSVDVPRLGAFQSGKTRANQFKEQIHALKTFLAARSPAPESGLDMARAVRFPQFLKFVGQNLCATGRPVTVLVLGSPLYLDEKEPGFSMAQGYFPSDGHLRATEEQSVYGLKDRSGALKEVVVHYGYFGDPWISEVHHEKVGRFWRLYVQEQGGSVGSFCGDLPTLFASVADSRAPARRKDQLRDSKLEMLRITRSVAQTDWIATDTPANVRTRPPSTPIGPLKIGIRWQGELDLDLYCRPRADAGTLSFQRTRIPEGYYFKDHRSSPLREYEFIEFESPVDVRQVEASVNFYEGHTPGGPSGEVRIEFDGGIYVGHFSIPSQSGNKARSGSGQQDHWSDIDVLQLLRLR